MTNAQRIGMNQLKPNEIILESFRIIESEIGQHPFSATEWPIVRRMVHASGDLDLVQSVCFSRDAASIGVQSLLAGVPLVTDVRMITAGIHKPSLAALGIGVYCFVDDREVLDRSEAEGRTRSACAIEHALGLFPEAIYLIGNAPTALMSLCATVRAGRARPQLLLALPVGFVSVVESKKQALELEVPVITVRGRKGGSAVAAAAINALLLMAVEAAGA